MSKQFNGVLLTGDVLETAKGHFTLQTRNTAANGQEYSDDHVVHYTGARPACVKNGSKVAVKARLDIVDKRTRITAIAVNEASDSEPYVNLARLIGELRHPFRLLPGDAGRPAIGNMLVTVGEKLFRAVTFGTVAIGMKRIFKKGSVVQVEGRLQDRPYENRDGNSDSMVEVVIDEEGTKLLKMADATDAFSAFEDSEIEESIPDGMEQAPSPI